MVQIGDAEPVEMKINSTDPMEGTLTITGINGHVTLTGKALVDTVGVQQVTYTEYDSCDALTITEEEDALIFAQTATDGAMTSKPLEGKLAKKVSYIAFPKTNDGQTMEMDITVLSRTDDASKDKGVYVGVFEIGNEREYFNSLAFRHMSGSGGNGGLTGYWIKTGGAAGNGGSKSNNGAASNDYNTKPSYELNKTYHVIFEKTNNGYKVTYQGTYADAASGVYPKGNADKAEMDLYKIFGYDMITATDEVQYGLALTGVTVKVENLTLKDSKGRTLYDQNAVKGETPDEGESTTPEEKPQQKPEEDKKQESSNKTSNSSSKNTSNSQSASSNLTKIEDANVPMAEQLVESAALPFANIAFGAADQKATLKLALLSKYHGKNMYMMAHLGNGIGYSISNEELGKATEDLTIGSSMKKVVNFADGFETFNVQPTVEKKLGYQIGLHMNVGTQYAGQTAYVFGKNLATGQYELLKAMTVNEIGNVAVFTNEMTEVMILIQQ